MFPDNESPDKNQIDFNPQKRIESLNIEITNNKFLSSRETTILTLRKQHFNNKLTSIRELNFKQTKPKPKEQHSSTTQYILSPDQIDNSYSNYIKPNSLIESIEILLTFINSTDKEKTKYALYHLGGYLDNLTSITHSTTQTILNKCVLNDNIFYSTITRYTDAVITNEIILILIVLFEKNESEINEDIYIELISEKYLTIFTYVLNLHIEEIANNVLTLYEIVIERIHNGNVLFINKNNIMFLNEIMTLFELDNDDIIRTTLLFISALIPKTDESCSKINEKGYMMLEHFLDKMVDVFVNGDNSVKKCISLNNIINIININYNNNNHNEIQNYQNVNFIDKLINNKHFDIVSYIIHWDNIFTNVSYWNYNHNENKANNNNTIKSLLPYFINKVLTLLTKLITTLPSFHIESIISQNIFHFINKLYTHKKSLLSISKPNKTAIYYLYEKLASILSNICQVKEEMTISIVHSDELMKSISNEIVSNDNNNSVLYEHLNVIYYCLNYCNVDVANCFYERNIIHKCLDFISDVEYQCEYVVKISVKIVDMFLLSYKETKDIEEKYKWNYTQIKKIVPIKNYVVIKDKFVDVLTKIIGYNLEREKYGKDFDNAIEYLLEKYSS